LTRYIFSFYIIKSRDLFGKKLTCSLFFQLNFLHLFFVLSKLLFFLINPIVWIVGCLFLAKFLKKEKWKRRSLTLGILLILFFSNEYLSHLTMYTWEERTISIKEIQQSYDIGIV